MSEVETDSQPQGEETEAAAQTPESAPETGEETTAEPEEQKKSRGVQKRLDELTRNWREEQRRSQWLEQQLELAQKQSQPEPTPAPQGKPQLDQFDSYEEYTEALTDWKVDQKLQSQTELQQQEQQQRTRQDKELAFNRKAAEFSELHEDFDTVVRSIPLSDSTFQAALNSEKSAEILYHLGQNYELAEKIDRMDNVSAAMELGRIEAALVQADRSQTNAPDPLDPIDGGTGGAPSADPDKMSMSEWKAWREKQLAQR